MGSRVGITDGGDQNRCVGIRLAEVGDHGNGAALPDEHRRDATPGLPERVVRRVGVRAGEVHDRPVTGVATNHRQLRTPRHMILKVFDQGS